MKSLLKPSNILRTVPAHRPFVAESNSALNAPDNPIAETRFTSTRVPADLVIISGLFPLPEESIAAHIAV
jgi:hypothetical protein